MDPHPTDAAPTSPLNPDKGGASTPLIIESPYVMRLRRLGFSEEQIAQQTTKESAELAFEEKMRREINAGIEKQKIDRDLARRRNEAKVKASPLADQLWRMVQNGGALVGPEIGRAPVEPHILKVELAWRPYGAKWPDTNLVSGVTEAEHETWAGTTTFEAAQQAWLMRWRHAQAIANDTMDELGNEALRNGVLPDETVMLKLFPAELAYNAIKHWELTRLGLNVKGVQLIRVSLIMKKLNDVYERRAAHLVIADPKSPAEDVQKANDRLARPMMTLPPGFKDTEEEDQIAGLMHVFQVAWREVAPRLAIASVSQYNNFLYQVDKAYLNEKIMALEFTWEMSKMAGMVLLFPLIGDMVPAIASRVVGVAPELLTASELKVFSTAITWAAFGAMDKASALAKTGEVLESPMRQYEALHSALWTLLFSLPMGGLGWFAVSMALSHLEEPILQRLVATRPGLALARQVHEALGE